MWLPLPLVWRNYFLILLLTINVWVLGTVSLPMMPNPFYNYTTTPLSFSRDFLSSHFLIFLHTVPSPVATFLQIFLCFLIASWSFAVTAAIICSLVHLNIYGAVAKSRILWITSSGFTSVYIFFCELSLTPLKSSRYFCYFSGKLFFLKLEF